MDWDNLRFFLAVARAGQFVAAGRSLRVDHATVNRRITTLERALNARLFDRRTTGVGLTAAGQALLRTAEAMETAVLQAQAALADTDVELSGTVRVGAPDGFSTCWLAPRCAAFVERHPRITIQLVPSPQAVQLAKREVDIAIVLDKPEAGRFVVRKLTDYALGIFGARDYLARHGTPATVDDLRAHRLVGYVEEYAYASALDYVRELFEREPAGFQCASALGQVEAVRAGLGLGIVHGFIAERYPDLCPVLPERRATRAYWIVEHEDTRGLGRIRAVHDFIVECVQGDHTAFAGRPANAVLMTSERDATTLRPAAARATPPVAGEGQTS